MSRGRQQGCGKGESGWGRGSCLQAGRQSSGDRRNRGTQMDKAELSWMNCPIKFTSAVDWIRTLSRAATSDIIHIKLLFSQIWNAKIFVRWWNTVRLAKKQLNWKREIGEESFFSLNSEVFLKICHFPWFQVGLQSGQHLQPLLHKRFPTGEVWVFHKFSQFSHTQRLTRRICTFSTKSINFSYLASVREAREATASSRC